MTAYLGHLPSRHVLERRRAASQGDIISSSILEELGARKKARALYDPCVVSEKATRMALAGQYVLGQKVRVPTKWGVMWARIEGIASVTGSIEVRVCHTRQFLCFTADVLAAHNGAAQEAVPK